jgi:hypothetical protein
MKHIIVGFGGLASFFFLACGSTPVPDPGITGPTITQSCDSSQMNGYNATTGTPADVSANQGAVCYPTTDIGTNPRTGTISGSRIADFAFTGYPETSNLTPLGQPSATSTVHLGDYYDPNQLGIPGIIGGVPIKLIHLTVAAVWCNPCNEETDFIAGANYTGANTGGASFASELAPLGVVFVQAIDDGPVVGTGATISDLNQWIAPAKHNNDFTTMVDPNNSNLGVFFDAAAVPFNANIDARSMEILSTDVGFDTQLDVTIKQQYLSWINANPPKM